MEKSDYNIAGYNLTNCYPNCKFNFYFNSNNDYICTNNSGCPPNMRYLIDGQKQCIETCKGTKYLYEFRKKCFEACPIESVPFSNATGNYCKSFCPLEKPFEFIDEEVCTSFCTIMEIYDKLCVTNYKGNNSEEITDLIFSNIRDDITDSFNYSFITSNQSVIIEQSNVAFEITSTKTSTANKISRIDLGKCETYLKQLYEIKNDAPLYILKVDAYIPDKEGPKVEYEIYYPFNGVNLYPLDLANCEGMGIEITFPINITEENLDLYNKNSKFYTDICYTYTSDNGTDIILIDRQNEFYEKKRNVCEEDCALKGYDKLTGTAECSSEIKLNIPIISEIKVDKNKLFKFMNIKTIANFKVMTCVKLFFSFKGIIKNIGFYVSFVTMIMYIICIVLFYLKGFDFLKLKINEIVLAKTNLKKSESRPLKKTKKNLFQIYLETKGINLESIKEEGNEHGKGNKFNNINSEKKIDCIKLENNNINNNKAIKEKDNKIEIIPQNKKIYNIESHYEKEEEENIKKRKPKISKNKKENQFGDINLSIPHNFLNRHKNTNRINSKLNDQLKERAKFSDSTLSKKPLIKNTKDSDLFNYKKNFALNEEIKGKEKEILGYTNVELDDLGYKKAIKFDHGTYLEYYFSLLSSKHLIIRIFEKNDYNSRIIKLFLCFFNFISCYAVNALFFSDETMHKIYEDGGDFNIIYQLPQIVYSTIISFIIDTITNYLANSQDNILDLKHEKKLKNIEDKAKSTLMALQIKFIGFFFISFLFLLLFWYYLGCFCAVYKNTQYHLIKDTLISFGTGNLYPLAINLIPGLFRIPSLSKPSKNNKLKYKFSKFISIF